MVEDKSNRENSVDNQVDCEECGKRIPKARLKVVPGSTMCVKCQSEFEAEFGVDEYFLPESDPSELSDIISPDD